MIVDKSELFIIDDSMLIMSQNLCKQLNSDCAYFFQCCNMRMEQAPTCTMSNMQNSLTSYLNVGIYYFLLCQILIIYLCEIIY